MKGRDKKQTAGLIILILVGGLVANNAISAGALSWAAAAIAGAAALPVALMYAKIVNITSETGFCGMLTRAFGGAGKAIALLAVLFFLMGGAFALRELSAFIHIVELKGTREGLIGAALLVAMVYFAKKGRDPMLRFSAMIAPMVLLLLIVLMAVAADKVELTALTARLPESVKKLPAASAGVFCVPFLEMGVLLGLRLKEARGRTFLTATGVAGIAIVLLTLMCTLVLGVPMQQILYFPYFAAMSVVSVGDFILHVEVLFSLLCTICLVVKGAAFFVAAADTVGELFSVKTSGALIASLAFFTYQAGALLMDDTDKVLQWKELYMWCAAGFLLLLPAVMLIAFKLRGSSRPKSETRIPSPEPRQ